MISANINSHVSSALQIELGTRAFSYLDIENSAWAYRCWYATGRYWWDEDSGQFVEETRPDFLERINGNH
jgi:hypothetical protein